MLRSIRARRNAISGGNVPSQTTGAAAGTTNKLTTSTSSTTTKSKSCIVRLEKIPAAVASLNKKETTEESVKKQSSGSNNSTLTNKNRSSSSTAITRKAPDRQNATTTPSSSQTNKNTNNKGKTANTPAIVLTPSTRSKRTPKPNPKYANENLISSLRGGRTEKTTYDNDDLITSSDDNEDIEDDDHLFSSSDDFQLDDNHEEKSSGSDDDEDISQSKKILKKSTGGNKDKEDKLPIAANHPSLIQFSTSSSTSTNSLKPTNKLRSYQRTVDIPNIGGNKNNNNNSKQTRSSPTVITQKLKLNEIVKTTSDTTITTTTTSGDGGNLKKDSQISITMVKKRKLEIGKDTEVSSSTRKRLNISFTEANSDDLTNEVILTPITRQIRNTTNNNNNNNINLRQKSSTPPVSSGGSSGKQPAKTIQLGLKARTQLKQLETSPARQKQMTLNGKNQLSKNLNLNNQKLILTPSMKIINKKPIEIHDEDNSDPIDENDDTNDDYEAMPTFTIVNIDDIIGKKGDVLIEKSSKVKKDSSILPIKSITMSQKYDTNIIRNNNNNNNNNRRKTMHTTILTDKSDKPSAMMTTKRSQPSPTTPQRRQQQLQQQPQQPKSFNNNNNITKTLSKSGGTGGGNILNQAKGPPRILNSVIGKKPGTLTKILSKVDHRTSPPSPLTKRIINTEHKITEHQKLQPKQKQIKENLQNNNIVSNVSSITLPDLPSPIKTLQKITLPTLSTSSTLTSPTTNNSSSGGANQLSTNINNSGGSGTGGVKRKLPSEKVIIQRQGNKIVKKITCFETWYVINVPNQNDDDSNISAIDKLQQRNVLDITLMHIANCIKDVKLPSMEWVCKVSLQKMNTAQINRMIDSKLERFCGDVMDPSITSDEKDKYNPINVMFRRNSKTKNSWMPYDRAVIFKNGTFFTNIDGKNVKLVGAPKYVKNFNDIEILLQVVDELTLSNQFVEPAIFLP